MPRLNWLWCLTGEHQAIEGPPVQAHRHCGLAHREFETFEQAECLVWRGVPVFSIKGTWPCGGGWPARSPEA